MTAIRLDAAYCAPLVPRRDPDGHKGTFGTLLCICGSLEYAGAALMCGLAGVRGGAGLVALAVPASLQPVVAGRVPETITLALPETPEGDVNAAGALILIDRQAVDALVIGPGVKETDGYGRLLLSLLVLDGNPVVVDAGALNLLAAEGSWWQETRGQIVLTPHPGEFARLTGSPVGGHDGERLDRAAEAARQFGHVIVLKGARTVVAAPDGRAAVSSFANAALATAGSGDVLAGLIGALLCQGSAPFDAACLGVYLHGRAGERLSQRFGDAGLAATDLPLEIALARHELTAHSA